MEAVCVCGLALVLSEGSAQSDTGTFLKTAGNEYFVAPHDNNSAHQTVSRVLPRLRKEGPVVDDSRTRASTGIVFSRRPSG